LLVALCLLAASAVPPAAGAEQAPLVGTASLTLVADRSTPRVDGHARLTATLTSTGPGPISGALVKISLPPGLDLLSAMPVSASLGTWSVPALEVGQTETLSLLVRVVAKGTHTALVQLQDGTQAAVTMRTARRHAGRVRHARSAAATT
jgi:hypothetical protein